MSGPTRGWPGDRRPTMHDIARLTGVSVSTVSRALADSPRVTQQTRARIRQVVAETGYVVNHGASLLRLKRARQILIILPNIANPSSPELVLGAEQEAQAHGIFVLIGNTSHDGYREEMLARQLLTGAVDGLILMTGRRPELLRGVPGVDERIVAAIRAIPESNIPLVSIDHEAIAATATRHLIALGHRRIAHITGPPASPVSLDRLRGFRRTLSDAGLSAADDHIAPADSFTIQAGADAMGRLLAAPSRPTALFCASDGIAVGAIKTARAHGIRVPDELSVIGIDDHDIAAAFDPPLTTVRWPRRALGQAAAALLLRQLRERTIGPPRTILPHELIVRESTRAAAAMPLHSE